VCDGRAEYGVWPKKDKISEWYENPAAMMSEFPLSRAAEQCRLSFPVVEEHVSLRTSRTLMNHLDVKPAHSFQYNGKWCSLGAAELATFYEDRALHAVGKLRMEEWASQQQCCGSSTKTGAALTFWYAMNNATRLPDAIEVGLLSTTLAQFEKVFCLTYPTQQFENMPRHITILDCNAILSEDHFLRVLHSNSRTVGFIAVLAEWIKQVGALELAELKPFVAVTTFDGDSLWQSCGIPPIMAFDHASATLELNPVSFENRDKPQRLIKLSYNYCQQPRDFLKIATPWRWPRNSPALASLVRRIRPMVQNKWLGGTSFETIMNIVWDTYNNWGLRDAFNAPQTHTIVPWFAWGKPLQPGSAQNPRWGMEAIRSSNVVCVNGMWQTSSVKGGPRARSRLSWADGSLVQALVDATLARCRHDGASWIINDEVSWHTKDAVGVFLRKGSACVTNAEKYAYVQVSTNT